MIVERREELCDVKCNDAHMALLKLASTDDVGEVDTSIGCGPLSNVSELIRVQKTISYHMKLELIADGLLNEFACSV